jgi:hypothetical protein
MFKGTRYILIATLLSMLMVGGLSGCGKGYSEGTRVGHITKLSRKGVAVKTWEGEMVMGGVRRDAEGNVGANIFAFTVPDYLVKDVQAAMNTGLPVELEYTQYLIAPPTNDSDYLITGVKQATGDPVTK